ncbi:MAG: elongation factor G [Firmicutes bacterium]|nr:elongation factor G [Bacillota bacterium]
MKKVPTAKLRNIALVGHGGAGKTTLAEAMLYVSGGIDRHGKVEEGTTTMDHDPEEVKRGISINASVAPCFWRDCKINIVDTPGYFDFVGEVISSLKVADTALIVVDATSGVQVGTEKVAAYATEYGLPKAIVVTKLNRENVNYANVIDDIRSVFGQEAVPVQIPNGTSENFTGVIDLLRMQLVTNERDKVERKDVEVSKEIAKYKEMLVEAVASTEDELMEKYFEGEELSVDEIINAFKKGLLSGNLLPIFFACGTDNTGIPPLLDAIVNYFPSPADVGSIKALKGGEEVELVADPNGPLAAFVFKTMADPYVGKLSLLRVYSGTLRSDSHAFNKGKNKDERIGQLMLVFGKEQKPVDALEAGDIGAVAKLQETVTGDTLSSKESPIELPRIKFPEPVLAMAVEPKSKGDEEKIGVGLHRLAEEDPTFKMEKNTETGQFLAKGMGDLHLEVIISRLKSKFGTEVELSVPKIAYRETIKGKVKVEGKHKKQSGGRGQYGHVWIEIEPLHTGERFEFVDKIFGGAVPKQYIPAVEKGILETMDEGVLAGYPVTNVKVTLFDGSYHSVDSSEMAFKIAASMAFKKGFMDAKPVLLEPILKVEIVVPEEYMGDVMGDLNKKRGKILGMDPQNGYQVIKALVPQAEMFRYATDLRSITQARGSFTTEFDHYEEVPAQLAEQVIAEAKAAREEAS